MPKIHNYTKFWIGFDRHYPEIDQKVDDIVTDFLHDFKPHIRVAGGDWLNCDQASFFPSETGGDLADEFAAVREILSVWKITHFLEGNHEQRLRRIGGKIEKRIRSLADITKNLQLKKLGVEFLPYHPAAGILRIGSLKVMHGWYCNEYYARKTAEVYGTSVFGHAHRFQLFQSRSAFDTRVGFGVGMLGNLDQAYVESRSPMGWAQGFAFGYLYKNDWFDLNCVRINRGRVTIHGKTYGEFHI